MNAINRHLAEQARKGFDIVVDQLTKTTPHIQMEFKAVERDDEAISFTIDGYEFSLTWSTSERQALGRKIPLVAYQLSIWSTTGGGRWHPPETVDTELLESFSIHECVKCALETVAKDKIRQCLEMVGYEDMAEEWKAGALKKSSETP